MNLGCRKLFYWRPNESIAKAAESAKKRFHLEMDIYVGMMDAGATMISELIKRERPKIIISRGGTALLLKEKTQINVVEIKMSLQDAADALSEAKKYGKKILFIAFSNHLLGVDLLGPLAGLEIDQIILKNWMESEAAVRNAQKKGYDVIVGGAVQHDIAQRLGMKSVFLRSGEIAILEAYQQALAMVNALAVEERNRQEAHILLNNSSYGVVSIDTQGNISLVNTMGAQLVNKVPEELIGKNIRSVMPAISRLSDSLTRNGSHRGDIVSFGSNKILFEQVSLVSDGKIIGAMATLKNINIINADERHIRQRKYLDGLYARYRFDHIIGQSSVLLHAKKTAQSFAKADSTVLIISESGTGKEMFAQSIHNDSSRAKGPFVGVNCASLSDSILESELFGYVDGAFTGAKKGGKAGVFEMAHNGTILLDEIGEISHSMQGKLLRVLQEKSIMRLGDTKIIPINVRVIAATNRDWSKEVQRGVFGRICFSG
jgi:transcriptional regulator with PAS, ATPase and Fis domain